jgi:hypothetical protein
MANLGPSEKPLRNPRAETSKDLRASNSGPEQPRTSDQVLNSLAEHAWDDLPYQIMRLTARESTTPRQRFYWRDRVLYLNEAQLSFVTSQKPGQPPSYRVSFRSGQLKEDLAISPTLEGTELRWIAPALSDSQHLTSQQLAAKLLSKLITF